jgi:hypothetical protein
MIKSPNPKDDKIFAPQKKRKIQAFIWTSPLGIMVSMKFLDLHDLLKKAFKARCKTNVMVNLTYVFKNRIRVLPSWVPKKLTHKMHGQMKYSKQVI